MKTEYDFAGGARGKYARPVCAHCDERIMPGELMHAFNQGKILMHKACAMRGVIGSVAHLKRECSCFRQGSTVGDPPGMTKRQAAEAAFALWEQTQKQNAGE